MTQTIKDIINRVEGDWCTSFSKAIVLDYLKQAQEIINKYYVRNDAELAIDHIAKELTKNYIEEKLVLDAIDEILNEGLEAYPRYKFLELKQILSLDNHTYDLVSRNNVKGQTVKGANHIGSNHSQETDSSLGQKRKESRPDTHSPRSEGSNEVHQVREINDVGNGSSILSEDTHKGCGKEYGINPFLKIMQYCGDGFDGETLLCPECLEKWSGRKLLK